MAANLPDLDSIIATRERVLSGVDKAISGVIYDPELFVRKINPAHGLPGMSTSSPASSGRGGSPRAPLEGRRSLSYWEWQPGPSLIVNGRSSTNEYRRPRKANAG